MYENPIYTTDDPKERAAQRQAEYRRKTALLHQRLEELWTLRQKKLLAHSCGSYTPTLGRDKIDDFIRLIERITHEEETR